MFDYDKHYLNSKLFQDFVNRVESNIDTDDKYIFFSVEPSLPELHEICKKNNFEKPIYIISFSESHQYCHLLHTFIREIPIEVKNYNIYLLGTFAKSSKITYKENTLNLCSLKHSPFSTFCVFPTFTELLKVDFVEKQHLLSCLMFGKTIIRDYIWTKLAENNLIEYTTYHSYVKNGKKLGFKQFTDYSDMLDTYEDDFKQMEDNFKTIFDKNYFNSYYEFQNYLPKTIDVKTETIRENNYFNETLEVLNKSLFNLVTETTLGWNIIDSNRVIPMAPMTEKCLFPFLTYNIPLILHDDNHIIKKHFQNIGLDMFDDIIPEEFYTNKYFYEKLEVVINFLNSYNKVDNNFKERLIHNEKVARNSFIPYQDINEFIK